MDQQFEWMQSNTHIDYPFESGIPEAMKDVFVDAVVIDEDNPGEDRVILNVLVIESLTAAHAKIVYSPSLTRFLANDITGQWIYTTKMYQQGQWLVIHFSDPDVSAQQNQLVLVVNTEGLTFPYEIENGVTPFVTKCVDRSPERPRLLKVLLSDVPYAWDELEGDVVLTAGYNMEIAVNEAEDIDASGARKVQPVTFNAVAGAGLGLVPNDCEGDNNLRTINGVGPDDNGNFLLHCKNCYRVWRPAQGSTPTTIVPKSNTLQIGNDCETCCECDDYGRVYSAMTRTYNVGRDTGKMLAGVGAKHKGLNDGIDAQRLLRSKKKFKMYLRPSQGYVLGVMSIFLNNPPRSYDLGGDADDLEFTITGDPDCDYPNCTILSETIYIFNARYEEWVQIARTCAFPRWDNPSPPNKPPNYILQPCNYASILGTSYAAVYHELWFQSASHGDNVTVKLESTDDRWLYGDEHEIQESASLIEDNESMAT